MLDNRAKSEKRVKLRRAKLANNVRGGPGSVHKKTSIVSSCDTRSLLSIIYKTTSSLCVWKSKHHFPTHRASHPNRQDDDDDKRRRSQQSSLPKGSRWWKFHNFLPKLFCSLQVWTNYGFASQHHTAWNGRWGESSRGVLCDENERKKKSWRVILDIIKRKFRAQPRWGVRSASA